MTRKKDLGLEGLERELRLAQDDLALKLIPRLSGEKLVDDATRQFDNIQAVYLDGEILLGGSKVFREGKFFARWDPYSFELDPKTLVVKRNGCQIAQVRSQKVRGLYAKTHKRMEDYCPPF
jgi:hypothetical protein